MTWTMAPGSGAPSSDTIIADVSFLLTGHRVCNLRLCSIGVRKPWDCANRAWLRYLPERSSGVSFRSDAGILACLIVSRAGDGQPRTRTQDCHGVQTCGKFCTARFQGGLLLERHWQCKLATSQQWPLLQLCCLLHTGHAELYYILFCGIAVRNSQRYRFQSLTGNLSHDTVCLPSSQLALSTT